jgi:glycosyltransferase involved in cell wall biosynthesis
VNDSNDLELYVIGGPNEVIAHHQNVLGNAGKAVFTGFVDYHKIPMYLRAVDVVAIPLPKGKHAETTSPIKLFEFMAAGKAIIAPDFLSIRFVLDDSSAYFFKADDVEDLARSITNAFGDSNVRKAKADAALKRAADFTWSKRAEKIRKLI